MVDDSRAIRTRYKEERTLARRLHRLPGEEKAVFKGKVRELHKYFIQFNLNVSELCQWLMGLREGGKHADEHTSIFWHFFISPEEVLKNVDEGQHDRYRLLVFDVVAKFADEASIEGIQCLQPISNSIRSVRLIPQTQTTGRLFERLNSISQSHRMILLKTAAEWIYAHYVKCNENWKRQTEEWEKEKKEWEAKHPELTEPIRDEFNKIFTELGVEEKRVRICSWERLKEKKDNCEYAGGERIGKQNHSPLCVKYKKSFLKEKGYGKEKQEHFINNLNRYLQLRKRFAYFTKEDAFREIVKKDRDAKWFCEGAYNDYIKSLGIDEKTILKEYAGIPHCVKFGDDNECAFNKHTEKCNLYGAKLSEKSPEFQNLDETYREWRKVYLFGPKKPPFKYPSSKGISIPKIFGKGYFKVDFKRSVIALRLDYMAENEFLEFGFQPWPPKYDPQPNSIEITSVNIYFIGTRAKVAFRFKVPHKTSRFGIAQDEINDLRSRVYPRQSQDREFLKVAREKLLNSYKGEIRELKILAVDLGSAYGAVCILKKDGIQKSEQLKLVKIDKLYHSKDEAKEKDRSKQKSIKKWSGLNKEHVDRHLRRRSEQTPEIVKHRKKGLSDFDLRSLTLHTEWMIRDWVRLNASQIIKKAEENNVDLIVFESQRGFKAPSYDTLGLDIDDKKKRLAYFSFGKIKHKVTEKAVERGMRVITVPYRYSSQFCSQCGKKRVDEKKFKDNKQNGLFKCEHCSFEINSDENASRVLGLVFWDKISLEDKDDKSD